INWNGAFTFGGSSPLNVGAGNVTLGSSVSVNLSSSTLTIDGGISGPGYGLSQNGPGMLVLAGNNSYTGPTNVNGSTLSVGNGGSGAALNSTRARNLSLAVRQLV